MKLLHKKRKTASATKACLKTLEQLFNTHLVNSSDSLSFQQIEQCIQRCIIEAGQQLIEQMLAMYDIADPMILYQEKRYHKALESEKTYQSLLGPVKVKRSLYRNKKHRETICPMEKLTGIVEGFWTPQAAKTAILFLTELPSEKTKTLLSQAGLMQPSSSSLDRLPKQVSAQWEADRQRFELDLRSHIKIPEDAVSLAVSLDGVMVPTRCTRVIASDSRFEEASCGTLTLYDAHGECIWKRQYGRMPEHKKATLKSQLQEDLSKIIQQRPDLTIVKVADGAKDNWAYFDSLLPDSIEVLDFYHASNHLKSAFDAVYGEDKPKSIQSYHKYRTTLLEDPNGISKVIAHLKYLVKKFPKKKDLRSEANYFQNHRNRARYQWLKSQGLPIGSGVVEAACKTLVTQRLKCSGMRWDYEGGQAILTFRALSHSQLFDNAWSLVEKHYHGYVDAANDENYPLFSVA
jgi:hypothetical protein